MHLTSSWTRKAICAFLVLSFVLLACLSGISVIGPQPARAQFGEFAVAAIGKMLGGIFSKTLDYLFNSLNDDGPDVEKILDEINAAIQAVSAELQATEAQLRSIFAKLMEMGFYTVILPATKAAGEVEAFWFDEFLPRFANKDANTIPQQVFQDFVNAWHGPTASPPLESDFNMIRDTLSHNATNNPRGALDQYTDMAITQMSTGSSTDYSAVVESTNGVGIVAERPMYFDYQDAWKGGHCQAGVAKASTEYFFAEGTTRPAFDSYICIQNPGKKAASVKVTYMRGDGTNNEQDIQVLPHSRSTVNAGDLLGHADAASSDFSVKLRSSNGVPVIAERPMYYNYKNVWDGGHCNLGLVKPSERFILAEGTCRHNFETYLCIQNPGDAATSVQASYLRGDGSRAEQSVTIPARSRATLRPSDVLGHGDDRSFDFSSRVETLDGGKIVVERPIYFNYKNAWLGGHCESGRLELDDRFYFAEGCVRPSFHSYICLANLEAAPSNVKVTFMRGDGTTAETTRSIPPHSRDTLNVADILGQGDGAAYDFSARVETTDGTRISAERVMYFDYLGAALPGSPGWGGGHCEMGLTETGTRFSFAEGTVRPGFRPYICIQNPDDKAAEVTVTYMKGDGGVMRQSLAVAPHSRETVDVKQVWNTMQVSGAAGDGGHALIEKYMGLEQLFGRFLHDQVMAVEMTVSVMNYEDPSRAKSQAYLSDTVAPALQQEAMAFLDNVARLVMSQAYLDMEVGKNVLVLPDQGQEILDRANFMVNLVYQQAVVGSSPVIIGNAITTTDVNPGGNAMQVTAKDKTTGTTLSPSTTYAVPSASHDNSGNPYYPTTWRKVKETGQISNTFYDTWDSAKKVVNYSSELSVTRYTFSGSSVVKGHSYDILDKNGKAIATTTVNSYDDEFNQDDAGENVFGGFEAMLGVNGSEVFMDKAGWSLFENSKSTKYSHQKVTNTYDIDTLSPKKIKTECKDDNDAPGNFSGRVRIGREFVAGSSASVLVGYAADMQGQLKVKQIMSGGDQKLDYTIELLDTTTGQTIDQKDGSMKMDNDSKDETMSFHEQPTGTFATSLIAGHTYALLADVHVDVGNGAYYWGPCDHWLTGTISDAYVTYLQ